MSHFVKINKKLEMQNSIDIMEMVNIMENLSAKDPNATLNLNDNFLILNEINGEIIINTNTENPTTEKISLNGNKTILLIPNDSVINLSNGKSNLTIQISKSGKLLSSKEDKTNLKEDVKYINDTHKKVDNWLWNGETGLSSMAIVQHLFLIPNNLMNFDEEISYYTPKDSDDYSRCVKMFEEIPELMEKISELSNINKEWKQLMEKEDNGLSKFENELLKVKENISEFNRQKPSQAKIL